MSQGQHQVADTERVAAVDARLAAARRAFCALLTQWFDIHHLTYRQIDALYYSGSGRRIPPATIARIRRSASNPDVTWEPQMATILALGEMNRVVQEITSSRILPPSPGLGEWALPLEPLRRLDGQILSALDICRILLGEEGIIESSASLPDRDRLEKLATILGHVIERAMIDAGRSPRRDLDDLLACYPCLEERDLLRRVVDGDAYFRPEQLHLALPGLALALYQFTGAPWSREKLLALADDGAPASK